MLKERTLTLLGLLHHINIQLQNVRPTCHSSGLSGESQQSREGFLQLLQGLLMETQAVTQGRAAHRLPGTPSKSLFSAQVCKPGALRLCGGKDSHAQAMALAGPGLGWQHRGQGPGSSPPALPLQACPRAAPLPTEGRAISLDDNYRVKCQPHSQQHHYPLAN